MTKCRCKSGGLCKNCPCAKANKPCGPLCGCGKGASSWCLNFIEAMNIRKTKMSNGDIKRALASAGLSPVGTKDEIVLRLGKYLQSQKKDSVLNPEVKSKEGSSGSENSTKEIIVRIQEIQDSHYDILSLSGLKIDSQSSVAMMRKAYLKLSRKIHPDKHSGSSEAKQAFQCLVVAFDTVSNPSEDDSSETEHNSKRRKVTRVQRSNTGCYKTKIHCPRCHIQWGTSDLGLEKGSYNFFMQAIKQYVCGRCACLFGCMTATHYCPHCSKFDIYFHFMQLTIYS